MGENLDLDTSRDLVIDESVCAQENNRKRVTFDLEEKCADMSSGSMSLEGMEQMEDSLQNQDEEDKRECEKVNDSSSDTIPSDDIQMPGGDEFDLDDDIPLMQNVHRP